ncbi:MAG: hypothetical protein RIQ71_1174 [Verrucomicrobiota bacterium]|jgi:glycosyltransferase involved in cell wall biosynthesis
MENSKSLRWWIIEDALCEHKGHWFEYLRTFQRGLAAQGDQVRFFASRECSDEVARAFAAEPVLPKSIWARMSDGALKWRRLLRIPAHAFGTYRAVSKLLAGCPAPHAPSSQIRDDRALPDLIFVPTVLVHHLAGWLPLIRRKLQNVPTRVLLFFPNTPLEFDQDGQVRLAGEPTAKLFRWYIRRFAPEVASGKVVLGAETRPMAKALSGVTGVPFTYLPHPVEFPANSSSASVEDVPGKNRSILCGAYGAARADKGSDLLQKAIRQLLEESPEMPARFALQWITDFRDENGNMVSCDPWLRDHPKVEVIDDYFVGGRYREQLNKTDVLLLPYGKDYCLRVSRVVIEALAQGKPVVVGSGTTLEDQGCEFGASVAFDNESVDSLVQALREAVANFAKLDQRARHQAAAARDHFSVATFRNILLSH